MDCLFNHSIPESTNSIIIIKPIGQTFINGLSSSYDESYPEELKPYIEENIYKKIIIDINETLINYWPCFCARAIGYFCCLCSLGLSLCMPNVCIKDAEETLQRQMDQYNNSLLMTKGLSITLVKKCSTSWLEIKLLRSEKSRSLGLIDTGNEMSS